MVKLKKLCRYRSFLPRGDDKIFEFERPDFVIERDDLIIGVEHCLVDLLFKTKRKQVHSITREQENRGINRINAYKDNPSLLDNDIKKGDAAKFVLGMVEEKTNAQGGFDYIRFIDSFQKILSEHSD